MSLEKSTTPESKEAVTTRTQSAEEGLKKAEYYSPEEKEKRRIIIEEAIKELRDGATRYEESRRRVEESIRRLL